MRVQFVSVFATLVASKKMTHNQFYAHGFGPAAETLVRYNLRERSQT